MGREAPKSSLNLVPLRVRGWHQRTLDFGISFSSDLQTWGPLIKTDRKAEGGPPEEVKLTDQFSTTTYPATLVKRAPCRLWQKGGKRELQLVSEQERRPRQVTGFWKQAIAIKAKTRSAMIRARLRRWGIDVALVGSGSSCKGSSSGWRKTQTAVLETMNDYTESIHSSERLSKARSGVQMGFVGPLKTKRFLLMTLIPILPMQKATHISSKTNFICKIVYLYFTWLPNWPWSISLLQLHKSLENRRAQRV